MNQNQERIQADLRGLLDGEVRCDDVFTQMYASDASVYECRPLAVLRPRHEADVVACVTYAAENQIPVHARGAGTGLAGESLGSGLVLDFAHYMRKTIKIDDSTARVQPGLTLAQLNRQLAAQGRIFGPDPATSQVTTMGSVLAIDASGSHWLQYGSARQHVVSMRVVLADGSCLDVGRERVDSRSADRESDPRRRLVQGMANILSRNETLIEDHLSKSAVDRCGYCLRDLLVDGCVDLPRLLVGSEGTLALTVEATVRTQPIPKHRSVALLMFDRVESAARAALEVARLEASACDLMDRRILALARETDVHFDLLIPESSEAVLLVETVGDDVSETRDRMQHIIDRACRRKRLAFAARVASDTEECELYWRLARRVVPTLYRLTGTNRPLPFVEDAAVPPDALPDFLVRLQNVLKKHQLTASVFAHAGHGQLHVRPFLDLADGKHIRAMESFAADLYQEVFDVRGTISGEHAVGFSRTSFVAQQFGPLNAALVEIKRLFDPHSILNPQKVIGDDPHMLTSNLRPVAKVQHPAPAPVTAGDGQKASPRAGAAVDAPTTVVPLFLNWSDTDVVRAARTCNGCGMCRTLNSDSRMCPIFRFAPREEASPRAKANLMRSIFTGGLDPTTLIGDELKSVADLCFNCYQCRLECPANVDIPKLMIECKAQYVATNGLRPSDNFLVRLETLSAFGSLISPIANWAIGNRQMRWLIEKALGVAQGRKLPRFAARSFVRRAVRRQLTRPSRRTGKKVVFFVDVYANWYDVQLAEALVAVLEHNGVAVYVHPEQRQSGMSMISLGALDKARQIAAHNVALLAESVRQGYQIVTTEPAAAICLQQEYSNLLEDDDAQLVAKNASEACTYLWRMHQHGKLRLDLNPVNASIGYHMPCHLKALQVGAPGENLLRLIPGLNVDRIEEGCSGMAGTFGLKRENYRSSLRAGWGLISAVRQPSLQLGTTECSSCKIQMEQGTNKPTIHPLKLMALAYGLMPEIAQLLGARGEELVVT